MTFTSNQRTDALPPPPPKAIQDALGIQQMTIEWLAGDGSDRCYYRIQSLDLKESLVLMQLSQSDARKLQDNGYEWVQIGEILSKAGIFVPLTVKALPEFAALIIEDYGDLMMEQEAKHLFDKNRLEELKLLYQNATSIICQMLKIRQNESAVWCQRRFDEERFVWEMNFFEKHYLNQVLNLKLSPSEKSQFISESQDLATYLANCQTVFVHRDFHSRNIMVRNPHLALLDFQDARLGPASYDLVSLVFDSYVPLNPNLRIEILDESLAQIKEEYPKLFPELEKSWSAMLLQRQLKAIGSFGYLTIEKKRGKYLSFVPKAMETLDLRWIENSKWPFISKDLLIKIRELQATLP